MQTSNEPDGVVYDVDALSPGKLQHFLLPALLGVVHAMVRAAIPNDNINLLLGASGGNDLRAQCYMCVKMVKFWARTGGIPFASCTAAIPTPPAAAVTSTHSPAPRA